MGQTFHYSDILDAETPREATRASFWRVRRREDDRVDWSLLLPASPSSVPFLEIDRGELGWRLRRHLPAAPGEFLVYWQRPREDGWNCATAHLLPCVPRASAVEVADRMECRALVRAERGRDACVRLIDLRGGGDRELGRDRLGMVDAPDLLEASLRIELAVADDQPLHCYAVGRADGWASAHLNRGGARSQIHGRLRAAVS